MGRLRVVPFVLPLVLASCLTAAPPFPCAQGNAEPFAPLEQWKQAVLAGDAARLLNFYSASPAAQVVSPENPSGHPSDDVEFWRRWRMQGLAGVKIEIEQQQAPGPSVRQILLQVELVFRSGSGPRKLYVAAGQTWMQGKDGWRIVLTQRKAPARLRQPFTTEKTIYPVGVDAKAEIAEAIETAGRAHKRVLLVFGGNWCFDCHVLDEAFHSPEIAPVLEKSFAVVHVDIGRMDKNLDIAKQYGVPLERGVPAIAVLDGSGKLLFSQKRGEFEAARSLAPEDILIFLNAWKPTP
jgi:thioredoxin 1